ncbi:fibronectin type III domain-containing protein [Paenibacillus sp. GYB004]|uniref:fibronectin type III domain-containing protein n=1 Tax=Paenibacillus sp. GYB004 TaxID=2994393 RepID=UPI002F969547
MRKLKSRKMFKVVLLFLICVPLIQWSVSNANAGNDNATFNSPLVSTSVNESVYDMGEYHLFFNDKTSNRYQSMEAKLHRKITTLSHALFALIKEANHDLTLSKSISNTYYQYKIVHDKIIRESSIGEDITTIERELNDLINAYLAAIEEFSGELNTSNIMSFSTVDGTLYTEMWFPVNMHTNGQKTYSFVPLDDFTYRFYTAAIQQNNYVNTYLELLDQYGNVLAANDDASGSPFSTVLIQLTANTQYFVRVYATSVDFPDQSIPVSFLLGALFENGVAGLIASENGVADISLNPYQNAEYYYNPSDIGFYTIMADYIHGGNIISDHNLSLFFLGDDNRQIGLSSGPFSSISGNFVETDYYYKIHIDSINGPNAEYTHLRLKTFKSMPTYTWITENYSVHMDIPAGLVGFHKFIPDVTGVYSIITLPFERSQDDSVLRLYEDPNLNYMIGYNDDKNLGSDNRFSRIDAYLTAGYTYYIGVYGYQGSPLSAKLKVMRSEFVDDTLAPNPPDNLSIIGKTSNSVSLSWTSSTDDLIVTGYSIYNSEKFIGSVTEASTTTYTVPNLESNITHTFTVKAEDVAGNMSASSNSVSVYFDTLAPTAPTNVSVVHAGASAITLSWTPSIDNVGIAEYEIFNGSSVVGLVPAGLNSFTIGNINANIPYTFMVRARDTSGNISAWSNAITAIIDTIPPSVPTNLQVSGRSANTITLTWAASTDNVGVSGYDIYDESTYVGSVLAGTNFYTISITNPYLNYVFSVKAKDAAGNFSDAATITVTPKQEYQYNSIGRLERILFPNGMTIEIQYDLNGNQIGRTIGN